MSVESIRRQVTEFRERLAVGNSVEDCFPAWYLHRRFNLPETAACMQSADPPGVDGPKGWDGGIDAFHLYTSGQGDRLRLLIVQAKFTDSIDQIRKGIRDLKRAVEKPLPRLLEAEDPDALLENKVIVNLRRELSKLSSEERATLPIDLILIHLSPEDSEFIHHKTQGARQELAEAVSSCLPDHETKIALHGPKQLEFDDVIVLPAQWTQIALRGASITVEDGGRTGHQVIGYGHLAELVDLYTSRRDQLFAKNVRYYLKKASNIDKGPAAKMRATLRAITVEKRLPPEVFAFLHNGVTLYASQSRPTESGFEVRDPYVLNGCQTIKTAYLFATDRTIKARLDADLWQAIRLPVRLTTALDQEFLREITVANNRQNAMAASALRANDPVQLRLEERFRKRGIIYERQEGYLTHLLETKPELFDNLFEQSNQMAVRIDDIARTIAAGLRRFSAARSPSSIFESDDLYAKVFSDDHTLRSMTLLVFLQNLFRVFPLVLRKDLELTRRDGGIAPSSLNFHAIALFLVYLARNQKHDLVRDWGWELVATRNRSFRDILKRELGPSRSKIHRVLRRYFLPLPSSNLDGLDAAFKEGLHEMGIRRIDDPFEVFSDLD